MRFAGGLTVCLWLSFGMLTALGQGQRGPNGVMDPLQFSGGDLGAQVNAAFAACAGEPCTVVVPPSSKYVQRTTIVVPAAMGQVLDCQSSTLTWAGKGDAVTVLGLNGDSPTGEIRNCRFAMGQGNRAAGNGIHQMSRIWFSYQNDTFWNWVNEGSAGLLIDNTVGAGWPGYSERTHIEDVSFSNDWKGLRLLGNDGGTNSLARGAIEIECNEHDGQTCLSVEGGADLYSVMPFVVQGNLSSNTPGRPASLLTVSGGSGIRTTNGYIEAECAGSVKSNVYTIADVNAKFRLPGGVWNLGGCTTANAGTSANAIGAIDPGGFVLQGWPYDNGLPQANNPKLMWNGRTLRYGIPVVGGYPAGMFQVFERTATQGSPEVDETKDAAAGQVNVVACMGPNGHSGSAGGCGFGPGYGLTASEGGTLAPRYALETTGGFGVRDASGRYTAGVSVEGRYKGTLFTPASSSAKCDKGEFADDANYHYVCVAENRWRRVALGDF